MSLAYSDPDAFTRLFDLPETERERAISDFAGGDPALIDELRSLIAHLNAADRTGFLGAPLVEGKLIVSPSACSSIGPPPIAGYRVLERVGSGSTGVVYRAVAAPPLERRVAIKVLRDDLPSAAARRFHVEQRLLASVNHPGVAQVYDAGVTPEGDEYVVTEFVEGDPITLAHRDLGGGWRQACELVAQAAEAVQHIHALGVLHRDIKPQNLLVTRDASSSPAVKIIDFGAATSIGAISLSSMSPRLVGTIAYMAPETLESAKSDVRSDVFSLGLVLDELLRGCHAFSTDQQNLCSLVKSLTNVDLPPLPKRLGPNRHDLEAIVRCACDLEPDRRYPTGMHLAEDLRRVLRNEPVRSRGRSPGYLVRKLAARRPVTVTSTLLTMGLILVLIAGLVEANGRSNAQRREIDATFSMLVDGVLDDLGELDGSLELRESLAQHLLARAGIPESLGGEASDLHRRARIIETLSDVAFGRGESEHALELRRRALEAMPPPGDDTAIERGRLRMLIKYGDVFNELRRHDEAFRIYEQAHDTILAMLDRDPSDVNALDELSWSLERLIPFALRESDLDRAIRLAEQRSEVALGLLERVDDPLRRFNVACADAWRASLRRNAGDPGGALVFAWAALQRFDQLVAAEPSRHYFRSRQISAGTTLCLCLLETGSPEAQSAAVGVIQRARSFLDDNPDAVHAERQYRNVVRALSRAARAEGLTDVTDAIIREARRLEPLNGSEDYKVTPAGFEPALPG